jgi:hypothetical protein
MRELTRWKQRDLYNAPADFGGQLLLLAGQEGLARGAVCADSAIKVVKPGNPCRSVLSSDESLGALQLRRSGRELIRWIQKVIDATHD